jgi:hypothetical protein
VGTAEVPEFREYHADGRLARIVRWPDHQREVSEQRVRDYLDVVSVLLPDAQRSELTEILLRQPRAPTAPAYYELVVSSRGTTWVGDYPGPESFVPGIPLPSRRWMQFDSTGVLGGVIETPAGLRVMSVDDTKVYGVHVDPLGVESIRAYMLPSS